MTAYVRTGDFPEALVKILLTIMEKPPGGGALVTFTVTGARKMIPWLMSWGDTIEVLEPQWLKEALVENLQQVLQKYR